MDLSSQSQVSSEDIIWQYRPVLSTLVQEDIREEERPTNLTELTLGSVRAPSLTTRWLEHTFIFPQYPNTDYEGYAYCINLDGAGIDEAGKLKHRLEHQYAHKRVNGYPKLTTCTYLRNVKCQRWRSTCTGIKRCEYMPIEEASRSHTYTNIDHWEQQARTRHFLDKSEPNLPLFRAKAAIYTIVERFSKRIACTPSLDSCSPVFEALAEDLDGSRGGRICCIHRQTPWIDNNDFHFSQAFPREQQLATDLIPVLLQECLTELRQQEPNASISCSIHENMTTRMPNCGVLHAHGNKGKLLKVPCNVEFNLLIPEDLSNPHNRYAIFVSHGTHTHLPPLPTRTPKELANEVMRVVKRAENGGLTNATFLQSAFLKEYLNSKQVSSLAELHPSFANKARIRAMIHYQKLLFYPAGPHFLGVQHEYNNQLQDPDTQYIQGIWDDDSGPMLICFYKRQAEMFLNQRTFEVDMSFKRIRQKDMNEVIFAAFELEQGKICTLARAFICKESAEIHKLMFTRVFTLLAKVTQRRINWRHHNPNNEGFIAVVMDMGPGQLKGFGLYLDSQDPQQRGWLYQVQNMVIYCRIHLRRSIEKIVGPAFGLGSSGAHMLSILTARSYQSYKEILISVAVYGKQYYDWARHKLHPAIACGLNKNCSKIPEYVFEAIRNHSNAVEQSAQKSYSMGMRQNLLPAIQNSALLDQRDIDEYYSFKVYGIRDEDRSANITSRMSRDLGRSKRKRTRELESIQLIDDNELQFIHPSGQQLNNFRQREGSSSLRSIPRSRTPSTRSRSTHRRSSNSYRQESQVNRVDDLALEERRIALEERRNRLKQERDKHELEQRRKALEIARAEHAFEVEQIRMRNELRIERETDSYIDPDTRTDTGT